MLTQPKEIDVNIYLLTQTIIHGIDTFNACVVHAETTETARKIHPSIYKEHWDEKADDVWSSALEVNVKYLGFTRNQQINEGVICASFRGT